MPIVTLHGPLADHLQHCQGHEYTTQTTNNPHQEWVRIVPTNRGRDWEEKEGLFLHQVTIVHENSHQKHQNKGKYEGRHPQTTFQHTKQQVEEEEHPPPKVGAKQRCSILNCINIQFIAHLGLTSVFLAFYARSCLILLALVQILASSLHSGLRVLASTITIVDSF